MTFGNYVANRRKELKISQRKLASKILREDNHKPISSQYLNNIETDYRKPYSDHLIRQFSKALMIDIDYLYYLAGIIPEDVRKCEFSENEFRELFSSVRIGTDEMMMAKLGTKIEELYEKSKLEASTV